ncbi:MAG: hypothetical protein E7329_05640 [Clostridiales bacterium]|nr:hypothetical protein [Clostridiales bacterium]
MKMDAAMNGGSNMEFLKSQKRFDFVYNGMPFEQLSFETRQQESDHQLITEYLFPDGLKITNIATKYENAFEWVNWLENLGSAPTGIISQLEDASVALPMDHEEPLAWTAFHPAFEEHTQVYAPSGSTWCFDEFNAFADRSADNRYQGHLYCGNTRRYATNGGRSSNKSAPFFHVHKGGKGYIFAIGWSGQWNCQITRRPNDVEVKTKIEDTHFRLLPGEKFRTSSFVVMPYAGSVREGQNQWRKLVKEHFSLVGRPGRDAYGPLCASIWGGMKTEDVIKRIHAIKKYELPFEYIWMDAGWYGIDTAPTPDEFEGDWGNHTGDWRVSPLIHSNNLKDVADAVHAAGMKFLLWFEPERVIKSTPLIQAHPEYFFLPPDEKEKNRLLNLGHEEAWEDCFKMLCTMIEETGIDFYRQDFNMEPLPHWRHNDREDRRGISEIKHINGLYRLWDALLSRFPHLMIDNCASGGRRIDIETLRRSIPLWRTDYCCPADYLVEGAQCHHLSFNQWMPFSGTGGGRPYDTYRIRSAYSPALTTNYTFSQRENFGDDGEKMAWLKERLEEYLKVRPLMTEDFYPLSQVSDRKDVWCASQFDRPSRGDGMLQFFRREDAPYETACYALCAIDPEKDYVFRDADDGREFMISGAELKEKGFSITMKEKRSSKLYFYYKK